MNAPEEPPIARIYDLNRLSEAGYEAAIAPDVGDRDKIAAWAGVLSVEGFVGQVNLKRLSPQRFSYAGGLEADIVQACAVSLEPVPSHIALTFERQLHLVPKARHALDMGGDPVSGEDDVPEEIETSRYDLAAPLLEEFLLAIDPYPRAPGAELPLPDAGNVPPDNPFAVLKGWKAPR